MTYIPIKIEVLKKDAKFIDYARKIVKYITLGIIHYDIVDVIKPSKTGVISRLEKLEESMKYLQNKQ